MHGVTTAIVLFILACLVFPKVVKNKPQYYATVGIVLVVILFDALATVIGNAGFRKFAYLLTAVLQMGAIFLLILAAGGLTMKDLAGDLADTIEVIRRGGEDKEIIIPRRGETPRPRAGRGDYADDDDDADRPARINLDAELRDIHPSAAPPAAPAPPPPTAGPEVRRASDEDRGIPLA